MKALFALVFALLLPAAANAANFEEGVHYQTISENKTEKPEVKEFFSFYCPHCHAFEPIMGSLEKSLPEGTSLKKFHVDFMGQASKEVQENLSQTMVLAKAKGKSAEVNKALFNHIHVKRQPFASLTDVKMVAVGAGLDAASFDKDVNSFSVKSQVKQMQKEQKTYSDARVLTGVPTIIVNGKYKINIEKLTPAQTEQELKALVNYLLTK